MHILIQYYCSVIAILLEDQFIYHISIPWLLIPWLPASGGEQQLWYEQCRKICVCLPQERISTICSISWDLENANISLFLIKNTYLGLEIRATNIYSPCWLMKTVFKIRYIADTNMLVGNYYCSFELIIFPGYQIISCVMILHIYVDGTSMSEVTPVAIRYIPPIPPWSHISQYNDDEWTTPIPFIPCQSAVTFLR